MTKKPNNRDNGPTKIISGFRGRWFWLAGKIAYQLGDQRNGFAPWPNVGHTVDVAVERIVARMAVAAAAALAGASSILWTEFLVRQLYNLVVATMCKFYINEYAMYGGRRDTAN